MKKVFSAVVFLSFFTIYIGHSYAVPIEISYQGYLTNAENVAINDLVNMTFRLYVEGEPDPIWEEAQEVQVSNGIYSIVLGADIEGNAIEPGIFDQQVFLGVQVDKDEEMTPRQKLTSASYSIRSETSISAGSANTANTANTANLATNATFASVATSAQNSDTVDGQHASAFAPTVHAHSGTITDADISPSAAINATKIADGSGTGLDADLLDGMNSTAFMPSGADNWVNESGDTMTGQLSLPLNGLVVGTDQLVVSSDNVGIGTALPGAKLHVSGNLKVSEGNIELRTEGYDPYIQLNSDDAADSTSMRIKSLDSVGFAVSDRNDATRFVVTEFGNVGIGTTTPGQKLSVAGVIESTNGGIKFPDGTVQSTTASGSNLIVVDPAGSGYTTIQAAINAITPSPTNRYTIEVKPGTYVEDIVMKSHIHLKGSGMDGTVIVPSTGTAITMAGLSDVKISGFTFQPESNPLNRGSFIAIEDVGSEFEVTECRFTHNLGSPSIYSITNSSPYIYHNEFIDSEGSGIQLENLPYVKITDNLFDLHTGGNATVWMINTSGDISRNTFLSNITGEAINVSGGGGAGNPNDRYTTVFDNLINGSIDIDDSPIILKGNRVTEGSVSLLGEDIHVNSNNFLLNGGDEALSVTGLHVNVVGNIVWGKIVVDADYAQVTGNTVIPGNYPGIVSGSGARIANNSVRGGNPSVLDSGGSEIIGNYLDPATGAVAIDSSSATTESYIWGNRVVQTPPDTIGQRIVTPAGIRLESTGDSVVITSGGSQISIDPSGAIQITGNTIDVTSTGNLALVANGNLNLTGDNVNIEALTTFDMVGGNIRAESYSTFDMLSGTNIKVDGGTTTDIRGSNINVHGTGTTDIQGSIVNIN